MDGEVPAAAQPTTGDSPATLPLPTTKTREREVIQRWSGSYLRGYQRRC